MRPVNKWMPGLIKLESGEVWKIDEDYRPYQNAKSSLCRNLGIMCSYCEKTSFDERDFAVEHIQPKKYKDASGNYIYSALETKWSNFLLSCSTCNGPDNKDTKNVVYGECHLPHLNNTFLSFKYDDGGVVMVNPVLSGKSKENAQRLLELVGLNKGPRESNRGDSRWKKRFESWKLAVKYLSKFKKKELDLETLMDLIVQNGNWSIWFTVFKGVDEVRKELINRFPGTAKECFDANNHYEPIYRHPDHLEDPV